MKKRKKVRIRDYEKEYREYQGTPERLKYQAECHKARRMLGLKTGDPREADHIKAWSKGGKTTRSNLRAVSRTTNRKKWAH